MGPCILSIAGSDSISGAGIQADLKTAAAFDCHAATAVTCVTAQNTAGFLAAQPADPQIVSAQISAVFDDLPVAAVKVGMLGSEEVACTVARELAARKARNPRLPIVVDPVLAATTQGEGALVQKKGLVAAISRELLPLATLVTPNLPESRIIADCCRIILSGRTVGDDEPSIAPTAGTDKDFASWAARLMIVRGAGSVLVKGGHGSSEDECTDYLFMGTQANDAFVFVKGEGTQPAVGAGVVLPDRDAWMRVPVTYRSKRQAGEFHGTGCTLSTAIACGLAAGLPLPQAVGEARDYLAHLLEEPLELGSGSYLLNQ